MNIGGGGFGGGGGAGGARPPAVAGQFYPGSAASLTELVDALFERASRRLPAIGGAATSPGARPTGAPLGLLVPHAGLEYSGVTAAAAWRLLANPAAPSTPPTAPPTVIILGTNHSAAWLDGIGVWPDGVWRTPTGDHPVDDVLAHDIAALGAPFVVDRAAHADEHSIEVQLPLLDAVAPGAPIVPLAVSAGRGARAIDAGTRLGRLLGAKRATGAAVVLVISTDMAHYPRRAECEAVTELLAPVIASLDPEAIADAETAVTRRRVPGLVCGMCGIEPTVLGLAALRALGATAGSVLDATTSASAGGGSERTVGYLSLRFD